MSTAELARPPQGQAARRASAPRGYVRPWLRLLRSELRLVFGRKRNLALMAVLAAIPVLLGIVLSISAPSGGGGDGGAGEFADVSVGAGGGGP